MGKFKIGDVVVVNADDDHQRLDKGRIYRVTCVKHFKDYNFVRTNLTGCEFFYEHRFVLGKTFKGNK